MTDERSSRWPNRNTLWSHAFVDELAKLGVSAVCIAPGSRSTPLTVAFADHPDIKIFSHLDERSAAFFALGRAKHTGEPTPVLSTSGTATANFHPAVIEANQARVPLVVLTADRPPELRDSGANQTIDQQKLYGAAVRWYRDLAEPEASGRKLRSLRVTAARAVSTSMGTPSGPVHLNFPFRKPLEPISTNDVPNGFTDTEPLAAMGRDGPFVRTEQGQPELDDNTTKRVADALAVERGLIVAGPSTSLDADAIATLAESTGFPVLADPLSGLRFGSHLSDLDTPICGGYDSFLDASSEWPDPDVVLRIGASPTSNVLRNYLRDAVRESGTRQFLMDAAGEWREATFTASDLLVCDPNRLARALTERVEPSASADWCERFRETETRYWNLVEAAHDERFFEGTVLADALADAPDPATVFVSNSMTIRDADRFAQPRETDLTVLGNRGASGIDGIVSTALGAGSATDDSLVLVLGDLAYYHDMNGLLALSRCGVDATVVVINNDGGGIFRMLPIADFDSYFEQFETPHGLDFAPTGEIYGFEFVRVDEREAFRDAYRASLESDGTQVIEVRFDAEASHRFREEVHERVVSDSE